MFLVFKYAITAAVVVIVSEAAKRSDKAGAVIASLPLITVLTLIWLHIEQQPSDKISNHAYYTFWYVLPSLPMFLVFPWLFAQFGFWLALFAGALMTALLYVATAWLVRPFGIGLL